MRARNIKPAFFTDHKLAKCSWQARMLFIALWCLADREGRLVDDPDQIQADLFLFFHAEDVDALLGELEGRAFITRYSVQGRSYVQIRNFSKHQKPHANETASTIPGPLSTMEASTSHHGSKPSGNGSKLNSGETESKSTEQPEVNAGNAGQDAEIQLTREKQALATMVGSTCDHSNKHLALNEDRGKRIVESGKGKEENETAPPGHEKARADTDLSTCRHQPRSVPSGPGTATASAALAQEFGFAQASRRHGASRDEPRDIEPEIAEMLRLGFTEEEFRDALKDEMRDRGERFWMFKKRVFDDPRKRKQPAKKPHWLDELGKDE